MESADTQITTLEIVGKGQENELVLSTIKELKTTQEAIEGIKSAWRMGDLQKIEQIGIKSMQAEFPQLSKNLLTSRNNAWLPKIKNMLDTADRELILVGALHLASEDGLVAQLKKQGYAVEQY